MLSMRYLPPLSSKEYRCTLLLSDSSAVGLLQFLLSGHPDQAKLSLTRVLAGDPILLLWIVCVSHQYDGFRPQSVADVADWFSMHSLDVLKWPEDVMDFSEEESSLWHRRASKNVEIASIASRLAGEKSPELIDRAYFLGLLSDSNEWLATSCKPSSPLLCPFLPDWLKEEKLSSDLVAAIVKKAKDMVNHGATSDLSELQSSNVQNGMELSGSMGNCLRRLAETMCRLAKLEEKYTETLEAEKLEAMAEFAAGAGHEINNPLTVIAGRAQLFMKDETDPERRRSLALMNSQAMRVYEMIADMMLFARPPKPNMATVDIAKLLDDIVRDITPLANEQETVLIRSGETQPVAIDCDATQLTVAIRALCQNSMEVLGRGGRIEIDLISNSRDVLVRVSDDGPGISDEERRHIFDPFFSARQAGRGLGLGLSKCWRIVTNHGGCIEVKKSQNQGAAFTIILPRNSKSVEVFL